MTNSENEYISGSDLIDHDVHPDGMNASHMVQLRAYRRHQGIFSQKLESIEQPTTVTSCAIQTELHGSARVDIDQIFFSRGAA